MVIYWLHNMDWMLIIDYIICRIYLYRVYNVIFELYKKVNDHIMLFEV